MKMEQRLIRQYVEKHWLDGTKTNKHKNTDVLRDIFKEIPYNKKLFKKLNK